MYCMTVCLYVRMCVYTHIYIYTRENIIFGRSNPATWIYLVIPCNGIAVFFRASASGAVWEDCPSQLQSYPLHPMQSQATGAGKVFRTFEQKSQGLDCFQTWFMEAPVERFLMIVLSMRFKKPMQPMHNGPCQYGFMNIISVVLLHSPSREAKGRKS